MAYGWLVARGDMAETAALARLVHQAGAEFGPTDDLVAELTDGLAGAIDWWRLDRDRARFAIRRAMAGLLAQWSPSSVLLSAADQVNDKRGRPLTAAEVLHAVRFEVARTMRAGQAQAR
jgi:hypothetical protein